METVSSFVLALQRAAHITVLQLQAALVDLDLGPAEINVLANLSDGQGRTVSQLSVAAGTRPTTLTSLLDRLERRDLVGRVNRADDRRSVLVQLTPAGEDVAAAVMRAITRLEGTLLRAVPPEAAHLVHAILDTLGNNTS